MAIKPIVVKRLFIIGFILALFTAGNAQNIEIKKENLIKELSANACKCIDSISVYNKSKDRISEEISRCIDKLTTAYQFGVKLFGADDKIKVTKGDENGNKRIDVNLNINKESKEYKTYYYELERYLMDNCEALKKKIAASDKQSSVNSISQNPKSIAAYDAGCKEREKGNLKKAIKHFSEAVKIDPDFAFAWDNIGLCYRKLGDYDKAIEAYYKSLEIDPKGQMPLQNIAVVYQYKQDYANAIKAYERLAEIDSNNPEVYYGIGHVYTNNINNYEAGLKNMCKAYNLYVEQKSPYRTDAEKVIQQIYDEMKKQGKLDKFNEILKENNISPN